MPDDPAHALEHLRAHRQGVLTAADTAEPLRFVIDPASGRLVTPLSGAQLAAEELVLFLPDESDDALELLLSAAPTDPGSDPACDRWAAYHGRPRSGLWGTLTIESGKLNGRVFDGAALTAANPLRAAEPALCRHANATPARLAGACRAAAGISPDQPVCVGVDPGGMDIRARFGIVRLAFPRPADAESDAHAAIDSLLARAEDAR